MMTLSNRTKMIWGRAFALALLFHSNAWAQLPPDAGPDVVVSESARSQFQAGVALLQDPDGPRYEEAYGAFMNAYAESPSWRILGNLGLCALKLERYGEGIEAMLRYVKYGGAELSEGDREQMERDIQVMKTTGATVLLRVSGGDQVTLRDTRTPAAGQPVSNVYPVPQGGVIELFVAAGEHIFVVSSGELRSEHRQKLNPGETVELSLELKSDSGEPAVVVPAPRTVPEESKNESSGSSLRTTGYVLAGVGVAGLIGAGVTAGLGLSLKGKLNSDCPDGTCAPEDSDAEDSYNQDLKTLKTYGTLTTVFAIGGGVLAAAGVTMVIVGKESEGETATLRLTPSFGPAFSGFTAQGAF